MKNYIALFRGINVGGHNLLPMKELIALLEKLGLHKIKTYIQSGNVVFQSPEKSGKNLTELISREIEQQKGFAPRLLLLEAAELEQIMTANPFPSAETEPRTLHIGFLADVPAQPEWDKLEALRKDSEQFRLIRRAFYLHAPEGIGRSKLAANAEKLLGVPMTDRNWRTVCKLKEMVAALS